ncbi:hypothetical protein Lesp02_46490 [Lentzea sp. NBRC 105346]|uniref:hypothetical protein n=1 Tax=Lentzea sp. NBRC 105346 TaxID=3032205 RepID=UPI0024A3246B|nr:hypothetical protein [Lentzea sp. NBRC 105346]GLZ32461.1 hypothetical protein Lesp02_46490 [Lentzea sp. NBRC 105346]
MKLWSLALVLVVSACGTISVAPAQPPDVNVVAVPTASDGPLCSVALPESWVRRVADSELRDLGTQANVVAASPDGRTVFTQSKDRGLLMVSGGKVREVMQAEGEFVGADFDGRWLTFGLGHSAGNLGWWTAYAWDSLSDAEPFVLDANPEGRRSGPLFTTFTRHGKAAWVVDGELHRYDLAARKDEIVARGVQTNPVFFGDELLWHENGVLRGPEQVRQASRWMAADEKTLAWVSNNSVYAWRAEWPEARRIAQVEVSPHEIQNVRVSGDLVTFSTEWSHVTDLRSGGTFRSNRPGYSLRVVGGALTVQLGERVRVPSAVPASELPPLPGC